MRRDTIVVLPLLIFHIQGSIFCSLIIIVRELAQGLYFSCRRFVLANFKPLAYLIECSRFALTDRVSNWYFKWAQPPKFCTLCLCLAIVNAVQIIKFTCWIESCIWSLWDDFLHLWIIWKSIKLKFFTHCEHVQRKLQKKYLFHV